MTKAELKAQHPELYAEIVQDGVSNERDRVNAILAFNEIDPKAVKEAIASGKPITETFRSEMAIKQIAAMKLKDIKDESPEDVTTTEEPQGQPEEKTKIEKEAEALKEGVLADLGIKIGEE